MKQSFPSERATEAKTRINEMVDRYGEQITESEEQFRVAESEYEARCFRFPDNIAHLVQTALHSLSELGRLVNDGKFDQADTQFKKFSEQYRAVKRAGRGLRLAAPFEWFWKLFAKAERVVATKRHSLTEAQMRQILDLVHKRATTQASNTFAVHPPQVWFDKPDLRNSARIIDELGDAIFLIVFQDGTSRLFTVVELVVFTFLLIDLRMQMRRVHRMASVAALPEAQIEMNVGFAESDVLRPEMVKALLKKVAFSPVSSDSLMWLGDGSSPMTKPTADRGTQLPTSFDEEFNLLREELGIELPSSNLNPKPSGSPFSSSQSA